MKNHALGQNKELQQKDFERTFDQEILKSEQRRVLLIMLVTFLLILGLSLNFFTQMAPQLLERFQHLHWILALLGLLLGYEVLAYQAFGWFLRRNKEPPVLGRIANAFIETSVPFFSMYVFGLDFSPAEALISPPAFVYYFFILLSILRLHFWLCLWTGIIAGGGYLAYFLLHQSQILGSEPFVFQIVALHAARILSYVGSGALAGLIAIEVKKRFLESLKTVAERNEILRIFGKHVSPEVVNHLLSQKHELESEQKQVCVLFLDIRNFTAFAESRSPHEVVHFLNALFEFMIDIINKHNGIINKFLGDGFMAIFGAPVSDGRDSENAVAAALEIRKELKVRIQSGDLPVVRLGIGIHAGETITGNVGSAQRKEYTIIGDTVNVAARIEALNKELGTDLLISQVVYEALPDRAQWTQARSISIRGRSESIPIFMPNASRETPV